MNGPSRLRALTVMVTFVVMSLCCAPDPTAAQTRPEFINFQGRTKAALYKPDSGPAAHVGMNLLYYVAKWLNDRF